jgi:heat shock protein HslJ
MNFTRIISIVVLVAFLGGGVYLMIRSNEESVSMPEALDIVPESEIVPETVTFYSASDEKATALFTHNDVTLTTESLGTITLTLNESSAGGLYTDENTAMTLWDRGDKITLWKGEEVLYEGYGEDDSVEPAENLAGTTWVWEKTEASGAGSSAPKRPSTFSLTFESDGTLRGVTDCNSFSGTYTLTKGDTLTFGPLLSTKMYCEGSQEIEFTTALGVVETFKITHDGSLVLFMRNEEGAITLRPQ